MLTGDKRETAIGAAYKCALVTESTKLFVVDTPTFCETFQRLSDILATASANEQSSAHFALIFDGAVRFSSNLFGL